MRKKTEQDYHDLAAKLNLEWIGIVLPKNVLHHTEWECIKCGLEIIRTHASMEKSKGCPECTRYSRKSADYISLAKRRGFKWIGKSEPRNNKEYTSWQCSKGHTWDMCYDAINRGNGCPHCAGRTPKKTRDYISLGKEKGFLWVAEDIPENTGTKTVWECKDGHIFNATYNKIQQNRGCPYCSGTIKKTLNDYLELAKRFNLSLVGEMPETTHHKTSWKCNECGNIRDTTYGNILQGHRCPFCLNMINGVPVSVPQKTIAEMLCTDNINIDFDNTRRKIDIAIANDKIAIEYDGWYWHKKNAESDKQKIDDLVNLGWKVLVIKSRRKIPSKEKILLHIARLETVDYTEIVLDDWGGA